MTVRGRRLVAALAAFVAVAAAALALWPREHVLEWHGTGRYVGSSRIGWWFSPPRPTRLPRLIGVPVIGATVEAVPGRWAGGAKSDFSWTGLRACPTRAGGACVLMADWREAGPTSPAGRTAKVNPAYAGWYVGAIETRVAPDVVITAEAWVIPVTTRAVHPAPSPGALVAVGPLVGPVG